MKNGLGAKLYLWSLILVLYLPIAIIIIYSFTESKVLGTWTGFSTKLYVSMFTGGVNEKLIEAIISTLIIALASSVGATILGTTAAIGLYTLKERRRNAIMFFNNIPILNPDIITGVSLFLLFVSLGISRGYTTVILAHIAFCTPYVVLSILPRLRTMNPNLYSAAVDLGATPFQAIRSVILPEIRPNMISGLMLAFTLSIDDFAVTLFTAGTDGLQTLSTYIYADAKKGGLTPELRPLFSVIFVLVFLLLLIINYRSSVQQKKKQQY